jgi:hypothetical protein
MAKSAIGLALLALAGCGGGGSDLYTPGVARSEAQKQCDSVMRLWCDGSVECVRTGLPPEETWSDAELDAERELCLDVAKRTCDGTLSVNDGYDACHASVESISESDCESIRTAVSEEMDASMPESCIGLFNGN